MGGAAKHIQHLYEDWDISFRKIKDIISNIGLAKVNEVYEKCDGINLLVTWDFNLDELKVARNKKHIKEGGLNKLGISLNFRDRPTLSKTLEEAYDILSTSLNKLPSQAKSDIFGSTGGVWFSTELIDPFSHNLIKYDNKNIIFHRHGPALFNFQGESISTNLKRNVDILKSFESKLNETISETDWRIHGPNPLLLKPVDESVIMNAHRNIDNMCRQTHIQPGDSIRTFLFKRLKDEFQRYPLINPNIREAVVKNLVEMPYSLTINKITDGLDRTIKEQINQMVATGKSTIVKILKPLEETIHIFGNTVLYGLNSAYIEDHNNEIRRLREHVRVCIDEIQNGNDERGKAILERNLFKLKSPDTINSSMEGIVFEDGSRIYKLTGAFAPANQICSYLKYKDRQLGPVSGGNSLAGFIVAG